MHDIRQEKRNAQNSIYFICRGLHFNIHAPIGGIINYDAYVIETRSHSLWYEIRGLASRCRWGGRHQNCEIDCTGWSQN
jgi:hypothetical protein